VIVIFCMSTYQNLCNEWLKVYKHRTIKHYRSIIFLGSVAFIKISEAFNIRAVGQNGCMTSMN
jgi:hypothetical protein